VCAPQSDVNDSSHGCAGLSNARYANLMTEDLQAVHEQVSLLCESK